MKNNMSKVHIFAAAIVLLIIGFSLKALMTSSTPTTAATIVTSSGPQPGVTLNGDVQEVLLSWGKFNYNPEVINLQTGKRVKLTVDTERLQGCFRSIRIPDLGISKAFTAGDNTLEFTPEKKGTFAFGCAMGMGKGTLVVA